MGNELGGARPKAARLVVTSALTITPLLWAVIALLLVEPHAQAALLSLYLDGSDAVLWQRLRELLLIVAVIEFFDSLQTVLGGVVQARTRPRTSSLCLRQECVMHARI